MNHFIKAKPSKIELTVQKAQSENTSNCGNVKQSYKNIQLKEGLIRLKFF
jgi:hypothetical protein